MIHFPSGSRSDRSDKRGRQTKEKGAKDTIVLFHCSIVYCAPASNYSTTTPLRKAIAVTMFSLARSTLNAARKIADPAKIGIGARSMSSEATFDLTGSFKVSAKNGCLLIVACRLLAGCLQVASFAPSTINSLAWSQYLCSCMSCLAFDRCFRSFVFGNRLMLIALSIHCKF